MLPILDRCLDVGSHWEVLRVPAYLDSLPFHTETSPFFVKANGCSNQLQLTSLTVVGALHAMMSRPVLQLAREVASAPQGHFLQTFLSTMRQVRPGAPAARRP